ncbi:MAG: SIS domain-containing protein [Crenarchaeota archaeon]|nr:SIS domain-containing protein [Thermoproteota archaeon]
MNENTEIIKIFDECIHTIELSKSFISQIVLLKNKIIECLESENKIIIFGNGGSASDAQHFAAELIGRFRIERKSLSAIALTTDTSIITAIGNDYGFDHVFERQCNGLVKKNDIIFAISTSGKSKNVIEGVNASKNKGAMIVGLLGNDGGIIKSLCDISLVVPSKSTPRIQEVHRLIMHAICELVDEYYQRKKD